MTDFEFGVGPAGPWIETGCGRVQVTHEELAAAFEQHGIKTTQPDVFEPRMTLGWNNCDPVAVCQCGARLVGDSVNDAALAWAKHLASIHKGEW